MALVQLNIHVPRDREALIAELEAEASNSGRAKNQIVLDALAVYLGSRRRGRRRPQLRAWNLGVREPLRRADIYDERAETKARPARRR